LPGEWCPAIRLLRVSDTRRFRADTSVSHLLCDWNVLKNRKGGHAR